MKTSDPGAPASATPASENLSPAPRARSLRRWYFLFFVVSGACSLVYEIAWLRLAMANFGVNTPLVSIVLSVFMAGLGLGSWGGGILIERQQDRSARHTLRRYAVLELLIGLSAVVVPALLSYGRLLAEHVQNSAAVGSGGWYLLSGVWITIALLPWCTCMGATIPFVIAAIGKSLREESRHSFSFLYVANVLGAVLGTLLPAFVLFELFGFRRTLELTALLNVSLAATVLLVSRRPSLARAPADAAPAPPPDAARRGRSTGHLWLLFLTGFVSLAMEVIWVRQFTPYLGTFVYGFATILGCYLIATFQGSRTYRLWNYRRLPLQGVFAWIIAGLCALLPMFSADPRLPLLTDPIGGAFRCFIGVVPFSGIMGFLTPMLVDDWSGGDPERAGKAYGVNVLGSILGPLVAGFLILPWLGERGGQLLLAAPLFLVGLLAALRPGRFSGPEETGRKPLRQFAVVALLALVLVFSTKSFETLFPHRVVRRDDTATVIATGTGMRKRLLVNGVGITSLTPITKLMADLPLAMLPHPPRNGLVICFGMGTSFRSMLSWGIPTTAVELVPSVPSLFGYYHADGPQLLKSPLAHVVIDDGRRFLERTSGKFDVILVDPPPPIQAAASSLLYSTQFYALAKKRLQPDGILQQRLPESGPTTRASVVRALQDSFPYVRAYGSLSAGGYIFLASERPLPDLSGSQLAARMPPAAVRDMLEWGPYSTAAAQLDALLAQRSPLSRMLAGHPSVPPITDNRPVNEYFFLRRIFVPLLRRYF